MNIFAALLGKQYNVLTYLPEAVLVVDETGKILYANKSAFSLFETSKLKGESLNKFFILKFEDIIDSAKDEEKQIVRIVTEEKNTKITDVKFTDVSSSEKKRYIVTVIDNTKEHSLTDELIAERNAQKVLNHTKNVLLSKMSNYISSPLNSVIGFSRAMLDGLSGEINEKQRKYLEIINSNTSDVLLFASKLIELSKAEADIFDTEYTNFDISALANIIANETSVKLSGKDIRFSLNCENLTKQNCYSDKNIVSVVITNLIDNAISQTDTGSLTLNISNPTLEQLAADTVNADYPDEKSYIKVELICKGIDTTPYTDLEVFDPYIQADKNSKKYLLQSLLLCSSKKLINKIKGELLIKNISENAVFFEFIIPVEKTLIESEN